MLATATLPAHIEHNTCTACGACCASFRVDFPEEELSSQGGCVPDSLADEVRAGTYRLRGTDYAQPRCAALQGSIGQAVWCGLHEYRPNVCRDFAPLANHGVFDAACNRARVRHGLTPVL
jgi:uncharacterized protein